MESINFILPDEVILKILSHLDFISLQRAKCTCRLWKNLIEENIPIEDDFNPYLEVEKVKDGDYKKIFIEACQRGNIFAVKYISNITSQPMNILSGSYFIHGLWNDGLIESCKFNRVEVVKLIISFGCTTGKNRALLAAVKNKNEEIVKLLMEEFQYNRWELERIFNSE